jgi:hypothetical protein
VEVVEKPLGGGRDEGAVPHVFGQRPVGVREHALVVAQARIDTPRAAAAWIDREVRCQRKRAFFKALRAERFFTKRLIAGPNVRSPSVEKQQLYSPESKVRS